MDTNPLRDKRIVVDPNTILPENRELAERMVKNSLWRRDHPEKFLDQVEAAMNPEKATAAGEPFLMDQPVIEYMTEEALVRSFALNFAIIATDGAPNQVPAMVFDAPTTVAVYNVAIGSNGKVRRQKIYSSTETFSAGTWSEFRTEPQNIPFVNPFFPRRRAQLEMHAQAKAAYALNNNIDTLIWNQVSDTTNTIKTAFGTTTVWTFKDANVLTLPTKNSYTSSVSLWATLRNNVIPYFIGQDKGDRVINIYLHALDLPKVYATAPVGVTLGEFTPFQQEVFRGIPSPRGRTITMYGHTFNIIPVNQTVTTGTFYANVGPVVKMWLPDAGNTVYREQNKDGSTTFFMSRIYVVMAPSIWISNVMYSTFSTTDTTG